MKEKPKGDTGDGWDPKDNWFCDNVKKPTVEKTGLDGHKRSSGNQLRKGEVKVRRNDGIKARSEEVRYAKSVGESFRIIIRSKKKRMRALRIFCSNSQLPQWSKNDKSFIVYVCVCILFKNNFQISYFLQLNLPTTGSTKLAWYRVRK